MDYYVLLTGGKNNAGDFLIKHRAKKLLKELRPDRGFKDFNAWEPFDEEKLEIVNNSKALILTGGPALQSNIYPGIYKLTPDLNKIKVPIISLGIGWKSASGNWDDIKNYKINDESLPLINRLAESGYTSSVRDYHTMHVLQNYGVDNIVMTGCPALYDLDSIGKPINVETIDKINFSLGVGFMHSKNMKRSVKDMLIKLKDNFPDKKISVKFHHSIDKKFLKTPDANSKLYKNNVRFSKWLETVGIDYEDISGSAQNLIESYTDSDFHIGYRVHAHIFMSSISKPSILIAEDGRGKGQRALLGGIILDGFTVRNDSFFDKVFDKVGLPGDRFGVDNNLPQLILRTMNSEFENGMPRLKSVRSNIDLHFEVMKSFIMKLP
ncbi:MAG: polysaccharide pyruvyl transferase family protein [Balneolaceae bacterium]